MQLISKFNKVIKLLLCVIENFGKNAWVIPLKDKNVTIVNAFKKNNKKTKWNMGKGIEFYNRSMKSWLGKNDIEIYSIHNQAISVVAERFIRIFKNKICKHMTAVSKNVYIDKWNDTVNNYYRTYHRTIKIKPVDVKGNTYIDFCKEVHDKYPKFKVGDDVRISKNKKIFAKGYTPNWSEGVFVIKKVKNTVSWTYVISNLNDEKLLEHFMQKNCKKQINKNLG